MDPSPQEQSTDTRHPGRLVGPPAAVLAGLGELVDFILPLWAAASLGLTPTLIGTVLAVELIVAVLLRPVAGCLADRMDRALLAATGALSFGAGFLALAVADGVTLVVVAAVLLGAGSAFFWVPSRAMVAETKDAQQSFAQLTEYEGAGIWIVYVVALTLLPMVGHTTVYGMGAVACAGAAILMVATLRGTSKVASARPASIQRSGWRGVTLVVFVAVVAMVEAAASIYLLLRLQQEFGLGLMDIVWLYLPGLVVYSLVPRWGAAITRRWGERTVVLTCVALSVAGVLLVTLVSHAWMLAVGWALLCWSWGWLDPLQQTTATRIFPGGRGRALGRYESATLAGGAVGSLAGGAALETQTPLWVAVAAVVVCLLTLLAVPALYRRPAREQPTNQDPDVPVTARPEASPDAPVKGSSVLHLNTPADPRIPRQDVGRPKRYRSRSRARQQAISHLGLYGAVQVVLVVLDLSWYRDMVEAGTFLWGREQHPDPVSQVVYPANMIWGVVMVLELLWASMLPADRGSVATGPSKSAATMPTAEPLTSKVTSPEESGGATQPVGTCEPNRNVDR